ncbi:MAG: hypothetical protein JSV61_03050 [Anaerolineales bacterium]|nr:MAG: hypothetical protein JSV61_03050 [Anaerolineales bacterium]
MKVSTIFTINAVVAVLFGLAFIFAPVWLLSFYGITADATTAFIGQLLGAAFVGFAIISWMARNAPASPARSAILLSFFIGDAIGFIVSLLAQMKGVANALGWSTVAIYLLLALAFGYLQFMGKDS